MLDINKILNNPTPLAIIGLSIFLMFTYLFMMHKHNIKDNTAKFIIFVILLISAGSIYGCFYIYKDTNSKILPSKDIRQNTNSDKDNINQANCSKNMQNVQIGGNYNDECKSN